MLNRFSFEISFVDLCMQLNAGVSPPGGVKHDNIEDEVHCITRCIQTPSCIAVDWRDVCIVHEKIQNISGSFTVPSNHYRKVKCPGNIR